MRAGAELMRRFFVVYLSGTVMLGASSALAQDASTAPTAPSAPSFGALPASVDSLLTTGSRRLAPGIRMGSFIVNPSAEASVSYDDNVFATKTNRQKDSVTNIDAGVAAVSNWSRHALELYAGGGGLFYADNTSEDRGYFNAGVSGQLDVTRDLYLTSYAKYAFGYEPRGSGESFIGFQKPIEKQTVEGGGTIHKSFNRIWVETGVSARHEEYGNGKLASGATVDQSFRNGTSTQVVGRVGYELSPKTSAFVEGAWNNRDYNSSRFNAEGYSASVGVRYEFTRLVKGEAAVGYMNYNASSNLNDVGTWSYRGQLVWLATPLMQVALVGSRDLGSPSAISTGSNRVTSDIGVRADYAWRRDVTFSAGIAYQNVDYVDIDRNDDYIRLLFGAEYQWSTALSVFANYSFTDLLSTDSTVEYDRNSVMVGLRARY